MRQLFIRELFKQWNHRVCPDTLGVCRMFNPHNAERKELRSLWAALGEGGWTVANVDRVLKSCVGTSLRSNGGIYTFVQTRKRGRWLVWTFAEEGRGEQAFAKVLRRTMAGRQMTLAEVYELVEEDPEELDLVYLATTCLARPNDEGTIGIVALSHVLRALIAHNVEGFTLVQMPSKRWLFVSR